MRLTHVRLLVDDIARSRAFYRDALGFRVLVDASNIGYAEFDAGDAILAVYERSMMERVVDPREIAGRGNAIVTFDDEDVDATFARLVQAGARPVVHPHDQATWGFRVALVSDPDGNLIEINHMLDEEGVPR